ncbi:MAG: hypothetical protein COB36_06160 [Alphaproteobacteria bacterium]|nr:MAG: hypothetical protein COB36_06160 [Alphaproteobacteria bacterium]
MRYFCIAITILLTGCATTQEPNYYVSPSEYESYSCDQLSKEMHRISTKRQQALAKNQGNSIFDTALKAYSISQGYGYSDEKNTELEALNNTYEVLDRLLIKEGC